ncbi:hypothetical protein CYMTET_33516, partial [Cymbomonas tetramitiformis]
MLHSFLQGLEAHAQILDLMGSLLCSEDAEAASTAVQVLINLSTDGAAVSAILAAKLPNHRSFLEQLTCIAQTKEPAGEGGEGADVTAWVQKLLHKAVSDQSG